MPSERRLKRINEVIRRVVSEGILEGGNFPPNVFITIARVKISGNLEWVDIDVSIYPEDFQHKVMAFLERRRGEFQYELNARLQARRTPKIRFHLDESLKKTAELFSPL